MGLKMGMALEYRSIYRRFLTAESPRVQSAGMAMTAGWDAYNQHSTDLIMYRFTSAVRALDQEIEHLRLTIAALEDRATQPEPAPRVKRTWWMICA